MRRFFYEYYEINKKSYFPRWYALVCNWYHFFQPYRISEELLWWGGIWQYLCNANIGVAYFFVLSGFGLYLSLKDSESLKGILSVRFAWGKIKRCYKSYVFLLLLTLPYSIIRDMEDASFAKACVKGLVKYFGCMTLLQSASGSWFTCSALLGTTWFLSALFICYMVCPSLVKRIRLIPEQRMKAAWVALISLIMLVSIALRGVEIFFQSRGNRWFDSLIYGSPYSRIFNIILGMFLGRAYDEHRGARIPKWVDAVLIIIVLVWQFGRGRLTDVLSIGHLPAYFLDLLTAVCIIISMLYGNSCLKKICESRPLVKSSWAITYIFLSHLMILSYVSYFFEHVVKKQTVGTGILLFVVFVIIQGILLVVLPKVDAGKVVPGKKK